MSYIGKTPTAVPLTSSDITDGIITTAKIADDAISAAKLAAGVGGKVLQVVTANNTTLRETTSTTYVSGTLSASITPSSTSNKVYIIMNLHNGTAFGEKAAYYTIYRNGTTNLSAGATGFQINEDGEAGWDILMGQNINHLDSPNTTSSTSYTLYFKCDSSGKARINANSEGESTITLMEIAG